MLSIILMNYYIDELLLSLLMNCCYYIDELLLLY